MRLTISTIIALGLAAAGCGSTQAIRITQLNEVGVHVQPAAAGWYDLRSDDGYRFSMPGLPLVDREEFVFGGARVPSTFCDLNAELDSRGYLFRAFDASELDPSTRDELREQAEQLMARSGEVVSDERVRTERGREVHDLVVRGIGHDGHVALVRTFVDGPYVFQLTAIISAESGVPEDAAEFFSSVELTEQTSK